jgi:hypothetical protein
MNMILTVLTNIFATGQITANSQANHYVDKGTPVAPNSAFETSSSLKSQLPVIEIKI